MTYPSGQVALKIFGILGQRAEKLVGVHDGSVVCHQNLVKWGPCREPHTQRWHHKVTQREMGMSCSLCLTHGMEGYQTLNQSLIPRGEGNCGSHRREGEIRHVI